MVVFTHGTFDDHHSFDIVLSYFTDAGYRTVRWDLPGHGCDPAAAQGFTIGGAARDLLGLIDQLGAERAVLIGHSLGGYISQEAAMRSPHRVLALVVIGTTSLTHRPGAAPMTALRASLPLLRLLPLWLLRQRVARHSAHTAAARAHTRRAAEHTTKNVVVRTWAAFVDAIRHIDPRRRLRVPALVCHGEQDHTGIIATAAPRWARRHSNITYHVIPGAGHLAHRDNPRHTAHALLSFLDAAVHRNGSALDSGGRR
ncbi:alpha/beta fold hydrolase [Lentzea californiensis]|uniref:alpha/beta fold hydrolase n=1 Tax=Lentzea californiensis TaxID=438851 RepID=UPI00216672C6|nr:alpha/beta hydrolase [Lentzea californiensis]MCR3750438.1 Pimeloyl-ACP methyl ester carboxylesterase [Lentzea californiensis]